MFITQLVCLCRRYKLLLTELLKHTPEDHPDYEDLCAAVQLVSGVVNSINEDIKRQEKRFKVGGCMRLIMWVWCVGNIRAWIDGPTDVFPSPKTTSQTQVMEVQERFDTVLVTASRKHEREGELIKMCRQGPKRFIFVLFNDLLIYGAQKLTSEKCVRGVAWGVCIGVYVCGASA